uniref:UBX domain-containing protein n=1 Tax=Petromyzon marinus TaxID=7757 RepID=S4RTM5_PETMA
AAQFGDATGAEAVPAAGTAAPPATSEPPTSTTATTSPPKRDYDQCRIQVRMPDGSQLMQSFAAKETLAAVRLFVELHRQDEATPFVLLTNFPRRLFGDEDMEKPLSELGLVPSAVLIMTKR